MDVDTVSFVVRYYLDNKTVSLRMIHSELEYGFEYLGNTSRLVVTPLTDRYKVNSKDKVLLHKYLIFTRILDKVLIQRIIYVKSVCFYNLLCNKSTKKCIWSFLALVGFTPSKRSKIFIMRGVTP